MPSGQPGYSDKESESLLSATRVANQIFMDMRDSERTLEPLKGKNRTLELLTQIEIICLVW
jgi:hypothetical protein